MHKKVKEYDAFKLTEYNGKYELVAGNDNEGTFYIKWFIVSEYDSDAGGGVPVKKGDGKYRFSPAKVVLGDRENAIENLKWLLGELQGHDSAKPLNNNTSLPDMPGLSGSTTPSLAEHPPFDNDVPF